jgi:hypothetical protein
MIGVNIHRVESRHRLRWSQHGRYLNSKRNDGEWLKQKACLGGVGSDKTIDLF